MTTLKQAEQLCRSVAFRYGIRFDGVRLPADSEFYEVRFRRKDIDWCAVLCFKEDKPLHEFRDEVISLAHRCQLGPPS